MIRKSLYLIFLMLSASAFSQETTLLKGTIHADSSLTDTYINIINLTQKTGTVNAPSGNFEIEVVVNDSLLFSSVQYEPVKVKISEEVLENGFLNIWLIENVNELAEVRISDIDLTGNLTQDLSNIPTFTQADMGFAMPDKPLPTSIERKLYTASGVQKTGIVNVSLDGIINSLNGKIEMLEKAKENQDLDNLVKAGMDAMPEAFFVKDLELPKSEIENFVYFCTETSYFTNLLQKEKLLELIEFYQRKAPEFIEERMGK